jgi:hypothetical protein
MRMLASGLVRRDPALTTVAATRLGYECRFPSLLFLI